MSKRRLALRVIWNLRWLGLFLLGPVLGVVLADTIFGMPSGLQIAASFMLLLSLGLFSMLFKGEWRRLSHRR